MSRRRRILVTGATGAQGGSVARQLLARRELDVRVMTRTPGTVEAAELRALGAEVVRGDMFDGASLRAAMSSVQGVFGVTSYWEHFERERELGRNLIEACVRAGVEHLVLSTQPPVRRLTQGDLNVPCMDIKAETAVRALAYGVPTTFVQLAFYYDNFTTLFAPQRRLDGTYELSFPQGDTKLAGFAVEDTGAVVARLFERPDEFIDRHLNLVGDDLTARDYAAIMSRITGSVIRYRHVSREIFAGYGFRGADELATMFEFYRTRAPERTEDQMLTRLLHPAVQSFEMWAIKHLQRIEQALAA
jgi:uncharacterized protein YbjT (DUF2867 family)